MIDRALKLAFLSISRQASAQFEIIVRGCRKGSRLRRLTRLHAASPANYAGLLLRATPPAPRPLPPPLEILKRRSPAGSEANALRPRSTRMARADCPARKYDKLQTHATRRPTTWRVTKDIVGGRGEGVLAGGVQTSDQGDQRRSAEREVALCWAPPERVSPPKRIPSPRPPAKTGGCARKSATDAARNSVQQLENTHSRELDIHDLGDQLSRLRNTLPNPEISQCRILLQRKRTCGNHARPRSVIAPSGQLSAPPSSVLQGARQPRTDSRR